MGSNSYGRLVATSVNTSFLEGVTSNEQDQLNSNTLIVGAPLIKVENGSGKTLILLGVAATREEISNIKGTTSNIQEQLNDINARVSINDLSGKEDTFSV